MADKKTYRHSKTGLIGEYDPRVALAHPLLIEVPPGSKPFALMPIPHEAVVDYLESREDQSDEGHSSTTKKRSK